MISPSLTVLMPVYNGGEFLRGAVESILGQTYSNFEFLIVDDGSTDESLEICRGFRDPRIRLEENGRNLGLIATLNRGLDLAEGDYIARMDSDDVSFPARLARQVQFMEDNPDVGICGTWYERVSGQGRTLMQPPAEDRMIRFLLIFDTVFAHSTIMLRRQFLEAYRLRYAPGYKYAEDFEFWTRCSRYTRLANIPETLLRYHFHAGNTSNRFRAGQVEAADRVRCRYLSDLGLTPTESEYRIHTDLIQFRLAGNLADLQAAGEWLTVLGGAARKTLGIPERVIHRELGRYWYGACAAQADRGMEVVRMFNAYAIGRNAGREWQAKLVARSLLKLKV